MHEQHFGRRSEIALHGYMEVRRDFVIPRMHDVSYLETAGLRCIKCRSRRQRLRTNDVAEHDIASAYRFDHELFTWTIHGAENAEPPRGTKRYDLGEELQRRPWMRNDSTQQCRCFPT